MDSSADLQIWDNAAFDNREISDDVRTSRQSGGSLKSVFGNAKASFDSVSGKENHGIALESKISSLSSLKSSSTPFKPLNSDEPVEKSRIKEVVKKGFEEIVVSKSETVKETRDGKKIDEEIEEIESQIERLNSRLDALRMEKTERSVKVVERRARIVPAKFMDQKAISKNGEEKKMMEEVSNLSARTKANRRGISLGPAEIVSCGRRGMSLGPAEIFGSVKSKQLGKQEMITPFQNRRKSCFLKLQDIEEEMAKSATVSPKSRKVATTKGQVRQAVTTVGSRKTMKKKDKLLNSVQPKKLFKDGEKSVPAASKKPMRLGRVVASRYNSQASAMRKRSLPEEDADNSKRVEKKRSLSVGKTRANEIEGKNVGTESQVKKRWEIPSDEIVVHVSLEGEKSPLSVVVVPDLLPRLRIARGNYSPRDSGPAKKVSELVGKKSFFASDGGVEESLCQELTYAEGDDEEV